MPTQAESLDGGITHRAIKFNHFSNSTQISNKVDHHDLVFIPIETKAPAQLLYKDSAAVSSPHEDNEIHIWNIHTLIEQIHAGHDVEFACTKPRHHEFPLSRREFRGHALTAKAIPSQDRCHGIRVYDGGAEHNPTCSMLLVEVPPNDTRRFIISRRDEQLSIQLRERVLVF